MFQRRIQKIVDGKSNLRVLLPEITWGFFFLSAPLKSSQQLFEIANSFLFSFFSVQTMATMNKQLKLPQIQKIMMEFEKQVNCKLWKI